MHVHAFHFCNISGQKDEREKMILGIGIGFVFGAIFIMALNAIHDWYVYNDKTGRIRQGSSKKR